MITGEKGVEEELLLDFRNGSVSLGSAFRLPVAAEIQRCTLENGQIFPIQHFRTEIWDFLLLGELYGCDQTDVTSNQLTEALQTNDQSLLNGHYLVVAKNSRTNEFHVRTNRYGTIHAYYGLRGNFGALGLSFRSVAKRLETLSLDWEALTGFMGFGFFPGRQTYYREIEVLAPATHYIFDKSGKQLSATRYHEWEHRPNTRRCYKDTVHEFGELFLKVMADLLGAHRVAVPVSGGLDSRSTVAAIGINGNKDRLWAYSYGYADESIETSISAQVAAARDLQFQRFTILPYLFSRMPDILKAVEGFQDVTQCRQAFVSNELKSRSDYVIAAHWGDVWLDDMGLVNSPSELDSTAVESHTFRKVAKRGHEWLLKHLCVPNLRTAPEEFLRSLIRKGMAGLDGIEDPDFRVKAFKTDNWSFRWTLASVRMFQGSAFPRLPFYDSRLADFFCTVPSEMVAGRKLQIDFLKEFAPDLARIQWQASGTDLYNLERSRLWSLPRRGLRKATRLFSGKKVLERNWEVQLEGVAGRKNLEFLLCRPGLKLHEFVRREETSSLVNEFYRRWSDPSLGYAVCMLLTFSAWLENQ